MSSRLLLASRKIRATDQILVDLALHVRRLDEVRLLIVWELDLNLGDVSLVNTLGDLASTLSGCVGTLELVPQVVVVTWGRQRSRLTVLADLILLRQPLRRVHHLLRLPLLVVAVDDPLREGHDALLTSVHALRREAERRDRRGTVVLDSQIEVLGLDQLASTVGTASGSWDIFKHHGRWL